MPFDGEAITILAGQIVEVGEHHIVLAPGVRVLLRTADSTATLKVGDGVTIRAVRQHGQYVAEILTRYG